MESTRIRKLPAVLANQIAAGEVVERPASVLKECLENSIDAGATQIEVIIEGGGITQIKISDNGSGILKEDLALALDSHATSKIQTQSDLLGIQTLGFRGEALASIAAVSKITIQSKSKNQDNAWQVSFDPILNKLENKPCAHSTGTTMVVNDLFFNVPARKKFLKTPKTEKLQCEEVFKRIALSHFDVGFSLVLEEKIVKQLPVCQNKQQRLGRIQKLCGKSFSNDAFKIEVEQNGLRLWGWLGHPVMAKAHIGIQYFFVNQRVVRDKVITHAVRQAFLPFCELGRHSEFVLFLDCDPMQVDVNVHPTKHEVRFEQPRIMHEFILCSITDAINAFNCPEKHTNIMEYTPPSLEFKSKGTIGSPLESALFLFEQKFLLATYQSELILFDLRNIYQERIRYELELDDNGVSLLVPVQISYKNAQSYIELFNQCLEPLGFDCQLAGPDAILTRSVPKSAQSLQMETFLIDLFNALLKNKKEMIAWLSQYIADKKTDTLEQAKRDCLAMLDKTKQSNRFLRRFDEAALVRLLPAHTE